MRHYFNLGDPLCYFCKVHYVQAEQFACDVSQTKLDLFVVLALDS